MKDQEIARQSKRLYVLAMVNAGIWAMSLIALVILLEGSGNLKGMFVILAGGSAVAIQLIAAVGKLRG